MRIIYFMRHGETALNREQKMQGQINCPLNDAGRRQARAAGALLAAQGVRFDRVYSSTLDRAVETASLVSGAARETIVCCADLIEMGFGVYDGVAFKDLPPEMFDFFNDPERIPAPATMEPIPALTARAERFLERLRSEKTDGATLVVSHGVMLSALMGCLAREALGSAWRRPLDNCGVMRVMLRSGAYGEPEFPPLPAAETAERAERICRALEALPPKKRRLVAIDGRCGAGKSTLATVLAGRLCCPVIHMDDFFLRPEQRTAERLSRPGENVDHERFLEEVLLPLETSGGAIYRPYNCRSGTLGAPLTVPDRPVVVVEGSYACHPDLWEHYDLRVFVDVDAGEQMRRIERRNGTKRAQVFRERWIPLEEQYFAAWDVARRCDIRL